MTVFGKNYADGYDALYVDKDYTRECDLIEKCCTTFSTKNVQRVLDIGCGTGGHSIELAHRGYQVTGVDISVDMIEIAREKAIKMEPHITRPSFHVGDAREFNLTTAKQYDAAIMMFAVIGYLNSNSEIISALANIRRHLSSGAPFICDFWWGPAVLTQRPGQRVRLAPTASGQLLRATDTSLDTEANVAEVRFELFQFDTSRPATQFKEAHHMRYFFGPELELLFKITGFELKKLGQFPEVEKKPTDASWNATAVACAV